MMFRTPKGCTTIKKTKKQKIFFVFLIVVQPFGLHNITALRADVCVCDSRTIQGSRTSWEVMKVMNPVSLKHPQDLLNDKHKQTQSKKQKNKKFFLFFCLCL
jgi:hypothetical protein